MNVSMSSPTPPSREYVGACASFAEIKWPKGGSFVAANFKIYCYESCKLRLMWGIAKKLARGVSHLIINCTNPHLCPGGVG